MGALKLLPCVPWIILQSVLTSDNFAKEPALPSPSVGLAVPFESGEGESGLLPDRTQGAGVSRRLAGEVYGLA